MWMDIVQTTQSGALLLVGLALAVILAAVRGLRLDGERRHRERERARNWHLRQL